MRNFIATACALALAACGSGDDAETVGAEASATPAAEVPALVGSYGSTKEDGTAWTSTLNADGTYQDTVNGTLTETGTWTHEGDMLCFTPAPAEGATAVTPSATPPTCLTVASVSDDGTLVLIDDTGAESTAPRLAEQ